MRAGVQAQRADCCEVVKVPALALPDRWEVRPRGGLPQKVTAALRESGSARAGPQAHKQAGRPALPDTALAPGGVEHAQGSQAPRPGQKHRGFASGYQETARSKRVPSANPLILVENLGRELVQKGLSR